MSAATPVRQLPVVFPPAPDKPEFAGPDHPMRKVTREVAFEGGWSPERAARVRQLFDGLAPEWHTRMNESRLEPLRDALERGDPSGRLSGRVCIEVGSGTGFGTAVLSHYFERVVAVDIAREMLARAPASPGLRVQADGAILPVADGSADCVALVNALLFPEEVDRVLGPAGTVLWVNALGDRTPIHLSADDVASALPGSWSGVGSEAGWGTWCVVRRR